MSRYPYVAGKKGDSDTGREGAEHATLTLAARQQEVREDLKLHGPSTPEEIAARIGRHWLHVKPRVSELKTMGVVIPTGDRRPTGLGGHSRVIRLTTPAEMSEAIAEREATR